MSGSQQLFLDSDEFIPGHDRFESRPYKSHTVDIEIDFEKPSFEIKTTVRKEDTVGTSYSVYVYGTPHSTDELVDLLDFITRDKPTQSEETARFDISLSVGHYHDRRNKTKKEINHLQFYAKWNRIIVETMSGENPVIPYYKVTQYNSPDDRENLKQLQSYAEKVKSRLQSDPSSELSEVESETVNKLNEIKYGNEVLTHLSDGDQCFDSELLYPALSSYIHAIEWAAIAYLQSEADIDVIEEETEGNRLYYFAGRDDSVISQLKKSATVDQKTLSRIEEMNRTERRWMAHHKSGDILHSEVVSIRERLLKLLEQLF
ncbi:hypothetical protein NDI76_03375 [Halogeometricum sp. S1BR25-6]|uniref:Uncharacterized protein n=1 Tax=Halogeometricum salsisoli TaxID=2950536 RepID=A0ABU2GC65_9EURY|nr:hypothetical protein [Halogeometricum sp. S1BR25-6]MDS0297774.1 hypothetical protein [Halogeometricum sp. S1BR25-6]